ncbi:hypothetical protein [Streptomyces sp. NPDC002619]|uniref:hypothetical protein n=1 Tax=Streptomyces sp. NPDC002619 TaxID=3364655 RepID=UPI0036808C3C
MRAQGGRADVPVAGVVPQGGGDVGLADRLSVRVRAVPAPHTAAVRGAAALLAAAHAHPSAIGELSTGARDLR